MSGWQVLSLIPAAIALAGLILILLSVAYQRRARRDIWPSEGADWEGHYFGHPYSPLWGLRERLPRAPAGCAWESFIKYHDGDVRMHLALFDLALGEVRAEVDRSLIMVRSGTYLDIYRRNGVFDNDYEVFDRDLIAPMVNWAVRQAGQADAGKSFGYRMDAS